MCASAVHLKLVRDHSPEAAELHAGSEQLFGLPSSCLFVKL